MDTALNDIAAERARQISAEGWTPEHDDEHSTGEMASAAACYARRAAMQARNPGQQGGPVSFWPWDLKWWKPSDPRRNLVKAAALIVAEIERLDRLAYKELGIQKAPSDAG